MWEHNPDGAGYAFVGKQGKVKFKKGFMKLEDLLADLEPQREKLKQTYFAIHFRIGTSGKNDEHTTHPFPISTDFGQLRKLEGEEDAVLFHNGVLGEGKIINELSSDTQDFVAATEPLFRRYSHSKARDKFIAGATTGSRLLLMYRNGKIKMYGTWSKDGELWVSNTYYQYNTRTFGSLADKNYIEYSKEYWDRYYNYSEYHPTTPATIPATKSINPVNLQQKLSEKDTERAKGLWDTLFRRDYVDDLTEKDINLLKRTADDYDGGNIWFSEYQFGYYVDSNYRCVWLEFGPEDYGNGYYRPHTKGEYDSTNKQPRTQLELDEALAGIA